MKRITSFRLPLFVGLLLLLMASCTFKKKLVSPMAVHIATYQWMNAKISGELTMENGETIPNTQFSALSFTGSLRMHRDSTVWLSVSAFLGLENARFLVTTDSIYMVNRVNQTYLAEPLMETCEVVSLPPTSVQELQSSLLGNGNANHVELRWNPYVVKLQYDDIQWDEPTTFPMKINNKYERIKLKP